MSPASISLADTSFFLPALPHEHLLFGLVRPECRQVINVDRQSCSDPTSNRAHLQQNMILITIRPSKLSLTWDYSLFIIEDMGESINSSPPKMNATMRLYPKDIILLSLRHIGKTSILCAMPFQNGIFLYLHPTMKMTEKLNTRYLIIGQQNRCPPPL